MKLASTHFHDSRLSSSQVSFYNAYVADTAEIKDEALKASLELLDPKSCRLWNDKVIISIRLEDDGIILDHIVSKTMRAGHGRQAFRFLKGLADIYNVPILLSPCSIPHPYEDRESELPNSNELEAFYRSEGCDDTDTYFSLGYIPKL